MPIAPLDDLPTIDIHAPEFLADPRAVLRPIQARAPIARSRRGLEVLRYDWAMELYSDRRFEYPGVSDFIAKGVPPTFESFLRHGFLLGFSGLRHDLIRRVIQKGFTIRRIEDQRELIRDVASSLVDEFLGETIDFVGAYTTHFPVITICRLLGIQPEDIPQFQKAAITLHLMGAVPIAPGFPEIEDALGVLRDYVTGVIADRRRSPKEDFVSALIEAEGTEGQLTEDELLWNIVNLLFAGQDTQRYQLAGIVHSVLSNSPELWECLAQDPGRAPMVLAEGIRYCPAVHWSPRRATEDLEFNGYPLSKGQWIFAQNLAASRDPAAFSDPDKFDVDRSEAYAIGFGRGLHNCVGQVLARTGMEESLKILSARMTGVHLSGETTFADPRSMIGGPEHMPISFQWR